MNIYEEFITHLQNLENNIQGYYEKHRILPGHDGGEYVSNNIVLCSFENHKLAHYYRWLAYNSEKDRYSWRKMSGWKDADVRREMASYAGKLGGRKTNEIHKERKSNFYDPEFQRRNSLKKSSEEKRKWMIELNQQLTPELRSKAGKSGSKSTLQYQRETKTGFFNPKATIQKLANLKRWGIVIDNTRVPYDQLSSDFIDYHINLGTSKKYTNSYNQQPSHPSEDGRFRD